MRLKPIPRSAFFIVVILVKKNQLNFTDCKRNCKNWNAFLKQPNNPRHQQLIMTTIITEPSICIPRTLNNVTRQQVKEVFETVIGRGTIDRVDIVVSRQNDSQPFCRIFVHFRYWPNTPEIMAIRKRLIDGDTVKVVYDNPWFWKCSASRVDKPVNNRPRMAPYIEVDSDVKTEVDSDVKTEVVDEVTTEVTTEVVDEVVDEVTTEVVEEVTSISWWTKWVSEKNKKSKKNMRLKPLLFSL